MTNKLIVIIILAGILASGFIYANYAGHPRLNVVQVSRGDVVQGVSLYGVVKAEKQAELGFENAAPAKITKLFTKPGDAVKAGAIIAQLDNADAQAGFDQASANASSAQLLLDELNKTVKKEKLKLKGLSSNDKKVQQAQVEVTKKSVEVQQAALLAAQAGVRSAQAELAKMIIRAPFDGIIANQDVEVGDLAKPGVPIVTLITNKDIFEIQAFASEQDIAKIKIGDKADVTLDAYGNAIVFAAQVTAIDPGETIQNGAPTYKVTFVFSEGDDRIKSGMNANVLLKTDERKDVVLVPQSSIISRDGKQFVLVSENGTEQEKEVIIGITGIDGMTEIQSGLSLGEYIAK